MENSKANEAAAEPRLDRIVGLEQERRMDAGDLMPCGLCPFCGKAVDFEDDDTLHPSGTGWYDDGEGLRTYHRYDAVPKEQWCWDMNCPTPAGGCGANVSGDSKGEALAKWNRRASNAPGKPTAANEQNEG